MELPICACDTWLIALETVSSGFDVVMRKLSKMSMSNKSGDCCCCRPFPTFLCSTTVVAFFLSLPSFMTAPCCPEPPSSSNAVSIVCLSTWIWPLWEPFVLILHTLKERNTKPYRSNNNYDVCNGDILLWKTNHRKVSKKNSSPF